MESSEIGSNHQVQGKSRVLYIPVILGDLWGHNQLTIPKKVAHSWFQVLFASLWYLVETLSPNDKVFQPKLILVMKTCQDIYTVVVYTCVSQSSLVLATLLKLPPLLCPHISCLNQSFQLYLFPFCLHVICVLVVPVFYSYQFGNSPLEKHDKLTYILWILCTFLQQMKSFILVYNVYLPSYNT